MSGYSEQSQRLARQLAEKAADNLRRSGRSVVQDAVTGRYIVGPRGGGAVVTGDDVSRESGEERRSRIARRAS